MDWKKYFETHQGTGVLATADATGAVDVAIYARPHLLEDGLGFIMADRRSRQNLQQNPRAAYLFREEPTPGGSQYVGTRLYLRKIGEEKDTERVRALRRRTYADDKPDQFLVRFEVEEVRPLVGDGPVSPDPS